MTEFIRLTSVAAPLPDADIDTDIIFPARFLLLPEREGLGRYLFADRRQRVDQGRPAFVLNRAPYDKAQILVAGPNFGSGSSREHAVWAIVDFGIRCIIAPSFGEIFLANCYRNGALPIVLDTTRYFQVMAAAESGLPFTVDLETQRIYLAGGLQLPFEIEPDRRRALLLGLDEIGEILIDDAAAIASFEQTQRQTFPWLYIDDEQLRAFRSHVNEIG
jgi:3-isopropylmalate/(R)-2-methylmalate dehydratase small subunit